MNHLYRQHILLKLYENDILTRVCVCLHIFPVFLALLLPQPAIVGPKPDEKEWLE